MELEGTTVLVVEDDDDTREVMRAMLELCGATVLVAESAKRGLETFLTSRPNAIVSDIAMPGEDGFALLARLRASRAHASLPVAALTAYASADDRRRILAAGFRAHLSNPLQPAEIAQTVATLAREGEARADGPVANA